MADIRLGGVAIRLVKFTDEKHNWAVFEIGRVSGTERKTFEPAFENLHDEDMERVGDDPTNGELQWKTAKDSDYVSLCTVRVCLYVKLMDCDSDPFGKTYDEADVTIEYHDGNVRPTLKKIISRGREGYHDGVSWFAEHPVNWNALEPLEKTFNINAAAIRLIEWIGDYAIVEIGRLSNDDVENLQKAFKGKDRYPIYASSSLNPSMPPMYRDPFDGKIEIETPIDGEEMMWKTARGCFYIGSDVRDKLKVGNIRNDCRIEIWYTNTNIRPVIDGITGEPIKKEELEGCWFIKHPTEWDEKYNASHVDIPKKEETMSIVERFSSVAIKVEEMLGGYWWRVKIGRLSGIERDKLKYLHANVTPNSALPYGDETNGKVSFSNPHGAEFYEAELCLRIREDSGMGNVRTGMIFDCAAFDLVWMPSGSEPRLVLQNFEPKPTYCIKNEHWFEEEEEEDFDEEMEEYLEDEDDDEEEDGPIEHEFRNVAVKVVSEDPTFHTYYILELGRLTKIEVEWLEKMTKLTGKIHNQDTKDWDTTDGMVISTYYDSLGYHAARICVYNLNRRDTPLMVGSIVDTANIILKSNKGCCRITLLKLEANTTSRNTSSKDWFTKAEDVVMVKTEVISTDDNATVLTRLGNVAIRFIKTLGTTQHAGHVGKYVIAEIGRLVKEEINALKGMFDKCGRVVTISDDETKGSVHAENATFLEDTLAQRFYTARVCFYIPNTETLNKLQACRIIDSANLTIKTFPGCIRPELSEVLSRTDADNSNTAKWFCKMVEQGGFVYSAGRRSGAPLTIKLNNVYLKAATHAYGERSTIVLGLPSCCNFQQAKEGIEAALMSRKIRDELRWDEYGKELAIKVEAGMAEALVNVAISKDSGLCLTLIFDESSHTWRVTINGVMGGYQGGFVYSAGRRSGKTAAMKAALKAAMNFTYGLEIPGGTNLDDAMAYCRAGVITQESLWRAATKKSEEEDTMRRFGVPKIEEVIIDEPAVIVKWADGSKTVVKARDEAFDAEKGLAMAIARKALGNDRDYYVYMQRHLNKALKKTKKRVEAKKATPKPAAKKPSGSSKKNGGAKK